MVIDARESDCYRMAISLNSNQVNYLNIGLMVLSAGLAFLFPFELFLLVYAVLGPLHYLTEISWLHDKSYFTQGRRDYLFLLGITIIITVIYFGWIPSAPKGTIEFFTGLAFLGALFFVLLKDRAARLWAFLIAALALFFFASSEPFRVVFGLFLPTLIHVFLFTAMFILLGALRGKSLSGLVSLMVFAGLAASFFFYHPAHSAYHASDYVRQNYGYFKDNGTGSSPFILINFYITKILGLSDFGQGKVPLLDFVKNANGFLYQNPTALALMSFIAFSYTYHYLNWFSKTSIIGWHEISRGRALAILALWGLSLGIYAYDYSMGLQWLFFLSFTHVFLEFPLNQLTLIGIAKEGRKMFATRIAVAEAKR
jgi:hypothetical protein